MKPFIFKAKPKKETKINQQNHMQWEIRRAPDNQLILIPRLDYSTKFNFMAARRGPRTTLLTRHR